MHGDDQAWTQSWSHNDQERAWPLASALSQGCGWIEPDVWVVGNAVLVGHDRPDPRRTLQSLYLDPLRTRRNRIGERYLVLDVKSDPERSLPVIRRSLAAYDDLLTHRRDGQLVPRPVTIVLSGTLANRVAVPTDSTVLTYDGRLGAVPEGADPQWMPVVSASWRDHFRWVGVGKLPGRDLLLLERWVEEVHSRGSRLRLWGVPDWTPWRRRRVWTMLLDAGVDVITTDHPTALAGLLRARSAHQDDSRGRPSS